MEIQKSDIEKIELRLIEAIKTSDLEFLQKTIHDDLLCLAPNGLTITKEMDMNSHKAGDMEVDELIPTLEDIRIIGDNAISTIVYDTKGRMLGEPIEGKFKYVRVWKKMDGDLKVIAAGCCKI